MTSVLWSHLFSTILGVNAENTADDALSFFTIGVEERDSFESGDDDGVDSAESSDLDGKAAAISFRRAARSAFHLRRTGSIYREQTPWLCHTAGVQNLSNENSCNRWIECGC